jgi:hypothetical protein
MTWPSASELDGIDTIMSGWNADLKIDNGVTRVWVARTGLDDGEPYESTVYVETNRDGVWTDFGHYDGADPPITLNGATL